MSNIEKAMVDAVGGDATVSGLVGARIYPLVAPQGSTRPYLVYQRISTPRVRSHDGPSGLAMPRFQWTGVTDGLQGAVKYSQLRTLADALRAVLDGYHGDMGTDALHTSVRLDNETEEYLEEVDCYLFRHDYILTHEEG